MRVSIASAALLSSLLFLSCKKDGETAQSTSPSGRPTASVADPGAHGPPVVVRLNGAPATDGSNDADVIIEIEVKAAIAVPAAFRINLPAGATATGSPMTDSVDVSKPGIQKRQIHVKSPTPLTDASAVQVSLEARDLDAGTGFRAERQWPPHAEAGAPHGGPRPPGGRPGASAPPPPTP